MGLSESECRELLRRDFSPEVLRAFLLAVGGAYKAAADHCKKHIEKEERHDVLGHVRRAKLDEGIRGVGERFSIESKTIPNANGSAYFMTLLSGEFRLICCLAHSPRDMVRPAKTRKLWAKYNFEPQATLGFIPLLEKLEGDKHLAILMHGPRGLHRDEAGYCDIVIPNPSFTSYAGRIKLFSEFREAVQQNPKLFRPRQIRREASGS